jgi:hypothetical protein
LRDNKGASQKTWFVVHQKNLFNEIWNFSHSKTKQVNVTGWSKRHVVPEIKQQCALEQKTISALFQAISEIRLDTVKNSQGSHHLVSAIH